MSQHPANIDVTPSRFELERDGHKAFIDYRRRDGVVQLIHTEVPPEVREKGVGSELVHSTLLWARENHLQIVPSCPFVAAYLKRHPEFSDLVAHRTNPKVT